GRDAANVPRSFSIVRGERQGAIELCEAANATNGLPGAPHTHMAPSPTGPRCGVLSPGRNVMTDLRLGGIAYRRRARGAAHAQQPGHGWGVTVVADPSERGKALARERIGEGVALVDDVDQLLAGHDVDAVMVLTPDFAHAEVALKTLRAGLPTF